MTSWSSSTSLITGAAHGMGRELTLAVLRSGGDVVAWDLDDAALSSLHAASAVMPGTLRTAAVDVTDREAVNVAAALAGPVDILVNNAGVVSGDFLCAEDPASIERVMNVNALALFWTTRAFLPAMIERNSGHIVTIASAAGLVPVRRGVSYTASKHAAIGFHDAVRQELRALAPDVEMTLVTPFFVDTGMFDGVTTRFPRILPILKQDEAIDVVMAAVERNRKRVVMPTLAALAYLYRALPARVSDLLLDGLGITDSMAGFRGSSTPRSESARTVA